MEYYFGTAAVLFSPHKASILVSSLHSTKAIYLLDEEMGCGGVHMGVSRIDRWTNIRLNFSIFNHIQSTQHSPRSDIRFIFFVARIFGIGIMDHILSDTDGRVE